MHADGWWGEGVVRWELESAPILAAGVWGGGRAGENVMPSVMH